MREFLWSEEMAEACVYNMENVNFIDLVKKSVVINGNEMIENCITIAEIREENFEIRNTHINIGTGQEVSIKNLALLVKEKVGFKGKLVFKLLFVILFRTHLFFFS